MELKSLLDLKNRNVLVTGGSQGIGKAIAKGMAEFGANVVIHYHSNHHKANETLDELNPLGIKTGSIAANLGEAGSEETIYEYCVSAFGHIDILVLNASIQFRDEWEKITNEAFEEQINVNLRSSLLLIQKFAPPMLKKNWGRVITIGSVQQRRPHAAMTVYSATKSALANMVISLAPDLAKNQVTINNVAPGAILTGRNEKVLSDIGYHQSVINKIPLGWVGNPVDCAGICVLLASDAGKYITGENIYVDGGMGLPT